MPFTNSEGTETDHQVPDVERSFHLREVHVLVLARNGAGGSLERRHQARVCHVNHGGEARTVTR